MPIGAGVRPESSNCRVAATVCFYPTGLHDGALGADAFTAPVHATVYDLITAAGGTPNAGRDRDWVAGLLDAAPDDRARSFVNHLAVEPLLLNGEPDEKYADEVAARVTDLAARRQIAELKTRLQRVDSQADPDTYNQLSVELMMLEIQRKSQVERATDFLFSIADGSCEDCGQVKIYSQVTKLGLPEWGVRDAVLSS